MTSEITSEDVEIRHLKRNEVQRLKDHLDTTENWKKLMAEVTIDCDPSKEPKYGKTEIDIIDYAGKIKYSKRGCTEIFLDEWGTSGRRRPKVKHLVMFLEMAKLKEAARYIVEDVLKKPYEHKGEDTVVKYLDTLTNTPPSLEYVCELKDIPGNIKLFSFCQLERATDNFNAEPFRKGGNKLGQGGFGPVYFGKLNGMAIAVKALEKNVNVATTQDIQAVEWTAKQFENEVETLSHCKHRNLLQLVGYCKDIMKCIVYEYMSNGSLEDRLACLDNTTPLPSNTRYSIALGVAEALHFLHSGLSKVIIHRDVKSANILLDESFVPKLGDFGIVKSSERTNLKTMYTQNNPGTSAYLPAEAIEGLYSTKSDVFSYGIVILELLTGLKPHNDGERASLFVYLVVDEEVPIRKVLDEKAGCWDGSCVDILVDVAWNKCCQFDRNKRAEMKDIVDILKNVTEH